MSLHVRKNVKLKITNMSIIVNSQLSNLLFVVEGDVGEELPPLAIDGIREPGMVGVKLVSVRQNLTEKNH